MAAIGPRSASPIVFVIVCGTTLLYTGVQMITRLLCLLLCAVAFGHRVAADNQPWPAGKGEGFQAIFNGQDLSGWVVEGTEHVGDGKDTEPVWTASDGVIKCAGHGFGFLRYDRELIDFILSLEYRLERGVNSGIGIRYDKYTGQRNTRPSFAGYEIQLLDDGAKEPTTSSTGSLYRYVAPKASAAKPAGEWNRMVIECRGPRIRVTLNDKLLHDVDQRSIDEIAKKPLRGHVSLQNHGGQAAFRDIRVKELK
jgi:hypothetical protein